MGTDLGVNITTDELLLIIGAKDVELYALRKRIAELELALANMRANTDADES